MEDMESCWNVAYFHDYLLEILNKEYPLDEAIDDLKNMIGSQYDVRTKKPEVWEIP